MSLWFTPRKILLVDIPFYHHFAGSQDTRVLPGLCRGAQAKLLHLLVPAFPSVCLDRGFCREPFLIMSLYHDGLFPGSGTIMSLRVYFYNTKGKEWVPSLLLQHQQ